MVRRNPTDRGSAVRSGRRSAAELTDERTEHAASARWLADRSFFFGSEAMRHETFQPRAVNREDTQRRVPRSGQLGCQLD